MRLSCVFFGLGMFVLGAVMWGMFSSFVTDPIPPTNCQWLVEPATPPMSRVEGHVPGELP